MIALFETAHAIRRVGVNPPYFRAAVKQLGIKSKISYKDIDTRWGHKTVCRLYSIEDIDRLIQFFSEKKHG